MRRRSLSNSPMRKILFFLILLCGAASAAEPSVEPSAPDVSGATRQPLAEARQKKQKAVALLFVTTDCPIANRFAPEITRLYQKFEKRGVAFYIVHADPRLKAEAAAAHAREYGFSCPVLLDRKHELVKLSGASVTPEAAVLSPQGKLLYRGRIDDRFVRWGQMRNAPQSRDLRLALSAVCAGKPVPVARTKAIGCYIEDAP